LAANSPCGKAIAGLLAGDTAPLNALPEKQRDAIVKSGQAPLAFACLAVADDKSSYCALLPKAGKDTCTNEWQLARDLKAQPADAKAVPFIATQLHRQCLTEFPQAQCDLFAAALGSDDATKCKGVPQPLEGLCAALATGNESLCPEGDADCRKMTAATEKVKKKGLGAFERSDPVLAEAAKSGRAACKSIVEELGAPCASAK
jgi:hypothetical protein